MFFRKDLIGEHRAISCAHLIIKVLSPSTALKARNQKFKLYKHTGLREFWLVDRLNLTIEVYGLSHGNQTKRGTFDTLNSIIFHEVQVQVQIELIGI